MSAFTLLGSCLLFLGTAQAVQILGGEPLSNQAPPFTPVPHPKQPNSLWGTNVAPFPTNSWWENAVLDFGNNTVAPLPYTVKFQDDGLHVTLPEKVGTVNICFVSLPYLTGLNV